MSSGGNKQEGGGCLAWAIGGTIVLTAVFFALSLVGHVLGLTPTFSEATDRPDGWVARHYEHVVWGYVLTTALLLLVGLMIWVATRVMSDDAAISAQAKKRQRGNVTVLIGLVIAAIALPIGERSDVKGNVPNVVGLSAAKAEDALEARRLDASFDGQPTDDEKCRVFSQNPTAGGEASEHAEVKLRCQVRVPNVIGKRADSAERRIDRVGLEARFINEPRDLDTSRCKVRNQSPIMAASPDAPVLLTLKCRKKPKPKPRKKTKPAPQPQEQNCDANYSGQCLDPAVSDYDCEGGSGNGPEYTGQVTVVGDDHFGLDTNDPDSIGCE